MEALILASGSPRRRQLLEQIGLPIEVIISGAEEPPHTVGNAVDYCLSNARAKGEFVAKSNPGRFVLSADTEVIVDGLAQGKPRDVAHGRELLRALSAKTHEVVTAFVLLAPNGRRVERTVHTQVRVKPLSDREIDGYLATGEPSDKAGAYGIQGIGTFLVQSLSGSYSNVVGLPVAEVLEALEELKGPCAFMI